MGLFGFFKPKGMPAPDRSIHLHEELRRVLKEKSRLETLLESMTEGVTVIDARKTISLVNTVLAQILGLEKGRVEGRYFWEVFRDPVINEMFEKALNDRASFKVEHSILLSERTFEVQISPVFVGADFQGAIAVFHDVTRLKELERMRTEFVANVSHELKTPLTSILGFIETLKEGAIEDRENRLHFLDIIEEHSRKLHSLIDNLLLLSREESLREAPNREEVPLDNLLLKIVRGFEKRIQEKSIQVNLDLTPKSLMVYAEALPLEQAIANLIDNAIKYSDSGGRIDVRARKDQKTSVIEIADTGIGIPESDLPRIFERFYRVDKSRARESGGTGLGLSIVKHIVERHGGSVSALPVKPSGMVFTLRLPLR